MGTRTIYIIGKAQKKARENKHSKVDKKKAS